MKSIYKGADQIISYRMGADLTEPYDKFTIIKEDDGSVSCVQDRVTNYGFNNGIKSRQITGITKKDINSELVEGIVNGTRSNN